MGNSPHDAHHADEEHTGGLEALDFATPGAADDGDHGLAAFDVYQPWAPAEPDAPAEPTFTVTNPPGTVTVSALFDGRVQRVQLSPKAVEAGEEPLAAEIVVIAGLATQRARAAQFSYMLEGMQDHGHDTVDTRDFLNRAVGLPSPEEADAARAKVFATRYQGDHD
ncbi:MAG: hypothetical protein U5N53_24465 [Mycobacterium sp.]|nr:hypothetical protein [Mycobacterium sp.]